MTRGERRRFQKRIRIIQRNIILSVLSILLISGLALTMNGIKSFAQKDNAELLINIIPVLLLNTAIRCIRWQKSMRRKITGIFLSM